MYAEVHIASVASSSTTYASTNLYFIALNAPLSCS